MQKRRPRIRCAIEGCLNGAWTKRNLAVCGDCAQEIVHTMTYTDRGNAPLLLRMEINQLRRIIARQSRMLKQLRDGDKPEPATSPKVTSGVVYYLRVGSYIKIGWTSDLEKRMRAYPPDSILLATEPGTRKDEHRFHKMFAAHRTHGREWYAMVPSLMHHIEQTLARHGQPDPVAFAALPVTIPQPRPVEPIRPAGWRGPWAS